MAKKVFKYRGKTLDELLAMSDEQIIQLMPSRARRTLKRGLTEQQSKLLKNIEESKASDSNKPVKTHVRDMIILPRMVGAKLAVYNGQEFTEFEVTAEMIGKYLSEYTLTRKPIKHSSPGVGATRSSLFVPIK